MANHQGAPISRKRGSSGPARPAVQDRPEYYVVLAVLLAVSLVTFVAWGVQLAKGIGVVGKNRPSFWGPDRLVRLLDRASVMPAR